MSATKIETVPAVGTLIRSIGGWLTFRVTESRERGCRGEATVTEAIPSQTYGVRQARKLTWKERHCDLFLTTDPDGTKSLRDWETLRAWEIVQ